MIKNKRKDKETERTKARTILERLLGDNTILTTLTTSRAKRIIYAGISESLDSLEDREAKELARELHFKGYGVPKRYYAIEKTH